MEKFKRLSLFALVALLGIWAIWPVERQEEEVHEISDPGLKEIEVTRSVPKKEKKIKQIQKKQEGRTPGESKRERPKVLPSKKIVPKNSSQAPKRLKKSYSVDYETYFPTSFHFSFGEKNWGVSDSYKEFLKLIITKGLGKKSSQETVLLFIRWIKNNSKSF